MPASAIHFSPPPSEASDRATSPALSCSSHTTNSFPTDISDISSLDGDDYEVIDAPPAVQTDIDTYLSESLSEAGPNTELLGPHPSRLRDTTIESEIDGSSFLAPTSFTHLSNSTDSREWEQWQGQSNKLQASASLITLHHTDATQNSSATSSMLRFPDPMGTSFQSEAADPLKKKLGVATGEDQEEGPISRLLDNLQAASSKQPLGQQQHNENKDPPKSQSDKSGEKDENSSDVPPDVPSGLPFHWNKRLITSNIIRAIIGLVVVAISTGVLPMWPHSCLTKNRVGPVCYRQHQPNKLDRLLLRATTSCTGASSAIQKVSSALVIKLDNDKLESGSSIMPRPSSKRGETGFRSERNTPKQRRSDHLSNGSHKCNALSVYKIESTSPNASVPTSLERIDVQHSAQLSQLAWFMMARCGRASRNAKTISTRVRNGWVNWADEMESWYYSNLVPSTYKVLQQSALQVRAGRQAALDTFARHLAHLQRAWPDWYHRTAVPFASKVFHQSAIHLAASQKKASDHFTDLLAYLLLSWSEWMQDAHSFFLYLRNVWKTESQKAKTDFGSAYVRLSSLLKVHHSQAMKGALEARRGLSRAIKEAGVAEHLQRLQDNVALQKDKIRRAAIDLRHTRKAQAVKKRLEEVRLIKQKHRRMMSLMQQENAMRAQAARWVNRGKAALYGQAIQSVQARHRFEDMVNKAAQRKQAFKLRRSSFGKNGKPAHKRKKAGRKV